MHSLNLKHSNWFFFSSSQIVQYFVSRQGELEQGAVFTCRMYTFCISTLCTRRRWLKKRRRLVQMQCTTTSWGKQTHFAQWYVHFVQPNPETWMLSGSQEQNRLFHTVEQGAKFLVDDPFFFFFYLVFEYRSQTLAQVHDAEWQYYSLQEQKKFCSSKTQKSTSNIDVKYMRDAWHAWTCHGTKEVIW